MKKNLYLFMLLCCSLLNIHLLSASQEMSPKCEQPQYKGNSLLYNLYDSSLNGFKGAGHAVVAVPCSFGLYIPYSYYKFLDLCYKRICLLTSNAATFNNYTREELERETALREFSNRGAKAFVSFLYMVIPIALIAAIAGGH